MQVGLGFWASKTLLTIVALSSAVFFTNAYSADASAAPSENPLPFEEVWQFLTDRTRGELTTLQVNRRKEQLVTKTYTGELKVMDVSEEPGDAPKKEQEEAKKNIVIKAETPKGKYGREELRFVIADADLKERASNFKRGSVIRITATLVRIDTERSGYINVSDTQYGEFRNVTLLELLPPKKN